MVGDNTAWTCTAMGWESGKSREENFALRRLQMVKSYTGVVHYNIYISLLGI